MLTQCSVEEATELELEHRGLTRATPRRCRSTARKRYLPTSDDTVVKRHFLGPLTSPRVENALHLRHRIRSADGLFGEQADALPRIALHLHYQSAPGFRAAKTAAVSCIGMIRRCRQAFRAVWRKT